MLRLRVPDAAQAGIQAAAIFRVLVMAQPGHGRKGRAPLRLHLGVNGNVVKRRVVDLNRQGGIAVKQTLRGGFEIGVVGVGQAVRLDGGVVLIAQSGLHAVPFVDFPGQVLLDAQTFAARIFITIVEGGEDVDVARIGRDFL